MARVLITGASGFIGTAVSAALRTKGFEVRTGGRGPSNDVQVGPLGPSTDWRAALRRVDTVLHLAGPAHADHPEAALDKAINLGTGRLARQAAEMGATRFVYLSTIKACADQSKAPLRESDTPAPADAYGRAKLKAERAVLSEPGLSAVVLRTPIVHAPTARANWVRFLRLLDSPAPLPLAGLDNRRSVLALDVLASALLAVLRTPEATGLFHLAQAPALSTTEMAALLRQGMGRPRRLFSAPALALLMPAQLRRSLVIDPTRFCDTFAFSPGDAREGLIACGRAWRSRP